MSINPESLGDLEYSSEPVKIATDGDGSLVSPPSLSTGPDKPHLMVFTSPQKSSLNEGSGWPFQTTATSYHDNANSGNDDETGDGKGGDKTPQKLAAGLAGAAAIVAAGAVIITSQHQKDNPGTGVSLNPPDKSGGPGTGVTLSGPEPTPYSGGPGTGVTLSGTPPPTTTTAKYAPHPNNGGNGLANAGYNGGDLPFANASGGGQTTTGSSGTTNGSAYSNYTNPAYAPNSSAGSDTGGGGGTSGGPSGGTPTGPLGGLFDWLFNPTPFDGVDTGSGGAAEIAADVKKISDLVDALKRQQTNYLNALARFAATIRAVYNKNVNNAVRNHMVYGSQLEGDFGKLGSETLGNLIKILADGGNDWRKHHATAGAAIVYTPPPAYVVASMSLANDVMTDVFPPDMKTAYGDINTQRDDMKKAIEEMNTALDATKDWWKGFMADLLRGVWKRDIFDHKDDFDKKLENFRMHFGILMADLVIRDLG